MKHILFLLITLLTGSTIYAQKESSIKLLDSAKIAYNTGQINVALNHLKKAETLKNSRQIDAEIFLYQARIYAHKRDVKKLEAYTREYLVLKPFTSFENDEFSEIIQTANQSVISPRWGIGASFGLLDTRIIYQTPTSLITSATPIVIELNPVQLNTQFALNTQFYLHKHFSVYAEFNKSSIAFSREQTNENIKNASMYFSVGYINLPLGLKTDLIPIAFYNKKSPFNLSLAGGAALQFRTEATSYPGGGNDFDFGINGVNANNYFTSFNYSFWSEISAGYRLKHFNFVAAIRYTKDQNNIGDAQKRYSIGTGDELVFENYQVIDDIWFNHLAVIIGVNYYLRFKIFRKIFSRNQ